MIHQADTNFPASATLQVGQRVTRKDSPLQGTVVEADGNVKVRWDNGRTSYFKRGMRGNVLFKPAKPD